MLRSVLLLHERAQHFIYEIVSTRNNDDIICVYIAQNSIAWNYKNSKYIQYEDQKSTQLGMRG